MNARCPVFFVLFFLLVVTHGFNTGTAPRKVSIQPLMVRPVKLACPRGSIREISTRRSLFPDPNVLPVFRDALIANGIYAAVLSRVPKGLAHSAVLGVGLWTFLGVQGYLVCVIYLILGSLVTKIRMKQKEALGIAEKRGGKRGPENVWGSAATAMTCAMLTYALPAQAVVLKVAYVASLATKLSDTFASEIGKAYGKNTYLITTLKMVPKGTEGAVSLEGTAAGVAGSIIMAAVGAVLGQVDSVPGFAACIVAAFVATTAESYIGAVFQDDIPWLTNELVNLINTIIGAVVAVAVLYLFS